MLRWRTRLTVFASWKNRQHGVAALRVVAAQQLERDLAAELDVLGAVHVAHAALAEQLGEPVGAEHRAEAQSRDRRRVRGTGGGFVGALRLRRLVARRSAIRSSCGRRGASRVPTASDGCESRTSGVGAGASLISIGSDCVRSRGASHTTVSDRSGTRDRGSRVVM